MESDKKPEKQDWKNDIIAFAGYWEPIAFIKRGGRQYRGIDKDHYPYSEEMARKLSKIGINLVVWHYYKGVGIKTEEEEMKQTAGFFKHCERYGIGKGVYINNGSFFADTFLSENPQAKKWLSRDQFGQPHQYSEFYRVYYRFRPCMSNLEFAKYVGKAAIKAIKEAGADCVFFDNSAQMPCYCDNCQKNFPEYLNKKFPQKPKKGEISFKERFGYNFTGKFELPRGTARMPVDNLPSAHEPGLYEWVRYRQHLYEEEHRLATKIIRTASKDALIEWNIALDYGEFTPLVWGLDPETAYRCGSDFFFSEDENFSGIEDGRLITHIRTYKYGQAMRNRTMVHNTCGGSETKHYLNYAEAAVFNQGCLGRVMWATEDENKFTTLTKALTFFRSNRDCYLNTRPLSQAVLYRCSESETGAWADTVLSRLAIEQVLIKNNIQYDCVINDRLEGIFNYPLLICANTSFVSDKAVKTIASFIKKGGKILCTEASFVKDEYGRKRFAGEPDMGLAGERDTNLGRLSRRADPSLILQCLGLDNSCADRIFYLPFIQYSRQFHWDPTSNCHPVIGKDYYVEPQNKDELLGLIRQALPKRNLELTAPENVIAGFFERSDAGRIIHILDYEPERILNNVKLKFQSPKKTRATFKTIDRAQTISLNWKEGFASCLLPEFKTYAFVKA